MKLAKRVLNVQPSPTLAVDAKANAMRAQGIDVVNFGVGQPDFDTPQHVCQAAKDAIDQGFTRYTPADGIPELKQAVCEKFKRDNKLTYTTDQVIINVGGKHSFYVLCQAVFEEGDEVVIPAPYWVSYPAMVVLAEAAPVVVPTQEANGFKLTLDELKRVITPRTRALVINSPSNPTGSAYTGAELLPLAEFCAQKGIMIISDEMYESILFDNMEFVSIASLSPEIYAHTITLNGVSKSHCMTGWRIGYMAGNKDIIKACAKIQSQSTSNPTSIAQKAAVAALNGPQDELARNRAEFEKRRNYIVERLRAIPGVTCYKPQGAFYVFPNFSAYFGKKFGDTVVDGSLSMADYLLDAAHVAIVPGVAFGDDNCMRFSYANSMEEIKKGIDRVEKALSQLK